MFSISPPPLLSSQAIPSPMLSIPSPWSSSLGFFTSWQSVSLSHLLCSPWQSYFIPSPFLLECYLHFWSSHTCLHENFSPIRFLSFLLAMLPLIYVWMHELYSCSEWNIIMLQFSEWSWDLSVGECLYYGEWYRGEHVYVILNCSN